MRRRRISIPIHHYAAGVRVPQHESVDPVACDPSGANLVTASFA